MKAFIYGGGQLLPENIFEKPAPEDLVIAADGGYINARALGARVDVLIGDMDSMDGASVPSTIEQIKLPCEKDMTDTKAAIDLAIERGYDDIVIIGGMGTRLDHTLSSLGILEDMKERGIYCLITNGYNRVRYLCSDSLLIARSPYKYLSLIALDRICKGVCAEGVKYPLKNARLYRKNQFAVSNEIDGNVALVSVRKGAMLIIESTD